LHSNRKRFADHYQLHLHHFPSGIPSTGQKWRSYQNKLHDSNAANLQSWFALLAPQDQMCCHPNHRQ
jgi:hypothetical protein